MADLNVLSAPTNQGQLSVGTPQQPQLQNAPAPGLSVFGAPTGGGLGATSSPNLQSTLPGAAKQFGVTPPYNPQQNYGPIQPTGSPIQAPNSTPPQVPGPTQQNVANVAATYRVGPRTSFYKPDPNSPQVYDAMGRALSYQDYINLGGKADFSSVINGPIPGHIPQSITPDQATQLVGGAHPLLQGSSQNVTPANLPSRANSDGIFPAGGINEAPNTPPTTPVTNDPTANTTSGALSNGPTTNNDVYSLLSSHLKTQDAFLQQLQNYAATGGITPEMKALQNQLVGVNASNAAAGLQQAGLYNPGNRAIPLGDLEGQGRNALLSGNLVAQQLGQQLQYAQGNRQFALTAAQDAFNAGQTNLKDTVDLYTKLAPQNIGTQYNPTTGGLYAITKNPISGETSVNTLGNIGAQRSFTSTNITTDPYTGALTFVGTTADGRIVQEPVGGGASTAGPGTTSSPLQGGTAFNSSPTGLTTPAAVNNNPGNLRDPNTGAWQQFSTPQQGFQALMSDIQGKQTGNTKTGLNANSTLAQFTSVYAPKGDGANNPTSYASALAQSLGVSPNTPIGQIPTAQLAQAVAQHEDPRYWQAVTSGSSSATSGVAPVLQRFVESAPGFTNAEYINTDRVPAPLQNVAKMPGNTLPALNSGDVATVRSVSQTVQNLEQLRGLSDKLLGNSGLGAIGSTISNFIGSIPQIGNPDIGKFTAFRESAVKTIQGLASGASGLRINQNEIDTAVQNLPTLNDNKQLAMAKIDQVESFLQNAVQQVLPHAQLAVNSSSQAGQPTPADMAYVQSLGIK